MFLEPDPVVTKAARHELRYYAEDQYYYEHYPMEERWDRLALLNPLLETKEKPFLGRIHVTFDFEPIATWSTVYCGVSGPEKRDADMSEQLFGHGASWRETRLLVIEGRQVLVNDGYRRQFFMTKRRTLGELVDRLALYEMFVPK